MEKLITYEDLVNLQNLEISDSYKSRVDKVNIDIKIDYMRWYLNSSDKVDFESKISLNRINTDGLTKFIEFVFYIKVNLEKNGFTCDVLTTSRDTFDLTVKIDKSELRNSEISKVLSND